MVLRGSFISQFHVTSPQRCRAVVRRDRSCVSCAARISSCPWGGLPASCCRCKHVGAHCNDGPVDVQQLSAPETSASRFTELAFDRLQVSDEETYRGLKLAFGRFVVRGALVDEEYWTAAWLRAEAHWESMPYMRNIDSFKRKYAEQVWVDRIVQPTFHEMIGAVEGIHQEFCALKRRCSGREGNLLKCLCIVTVKKEDPSVRRTVLNSVVGTLDLSVRQFFHGERFPGEIRRTCPLLASHGASDAHRYAYIANVCVSKFARRQGIASNMLHLATDVAVSSGVKQLFVHVNADNKPAQDLYKKIGFEIVEEASSPLSRDQNLLLCSEL